MHPILGPSSRITTPADDIIEDCKHSLFSATATPITQSGLKIDSLIPVNEEAHFPGCGRPSN